MSTPVSPSLGCARLELKNTQCSSITITDGMKLLRHAVSSGNSDKVHKLLKCSHISPIDHGADMPIICTAAWKGYTDIIGLLIRHGASVNTRSTEGSTALIYAADGGHLTVLSLLLDAGALINITNCHGESALTRATRRGWVHCARFLLSHGANPNPMPSDGHSFVVSPLHLARQMHQTIIEQDILKRTVEIDKAVAEIVSTTLPNHLTLIEPGHLPDTKSMSLFPVQIISSVELSRFVLYFKTPPGYGSRSPLVGSKESSGSTPSDELIFIYVIRAQLCDNHVSCWLTGPPMNSLALIFNGTKKHCNMIPLSSEYSGICVYSVSTVIRSGGLNTICLELRTKNSPTTETVQSSSYDSVVLIGGYRIRLDVTSLIMASMNPVSPKGTTKASVYIPRSGI
ncbi:M-phase phosphoprotein 8 isoform 2 [Schistosoma japonicum]|uniref:M-phase phosphoprotein 8 isoform 2 n=3 Tax=Schistosoma japonicum TaxID=6182 RepID=A0A4Z2D5Q0_SCHJA|nr:M-phase phosphoprotein 8 isoform 2 [Schistosoma japonicum]